MDQHYLFESIPEDKYDLLTREDLITITKDQDDLIKQILKSNKELIAKLFKNEQRSFLLGEETILIKNKLFGKSSEKSSKKSKNKETRGSSRKRVLLPSERYPNLDIIEKEVTLEKIPDCPCCNKKMKDSGLTEDSEYLTVIPRKYYIVKQKRHKYRCGSCQEGLITAPPIPRIKPGSSYSDEMIVDVALSKYCDLIPVERYSSMAKRDGVEGIPANSLIQGTHNVADFLEEIYRRIKEEVQNSKVLHADETPHRMLEGDKKSNWYLWGFSTDKASYFENHDSRSGTVASSFLKDSSCEYLVSDVFSGYSRAVKDSNELRIKEKKAIIKNIYCNAHARRKFKESINNFEEESKLFLWCYQKIYHQEKTNKNRIWQKIYFKAMEKKALSLMRSFSNKSSIAKAINYFLKNYDELTLFVNYKDIPIDNNAQERLLRSPVIGRKTWFGTHSKRGAKTNAILFSLVESCKLNKINPREYFRDIVHAIHEKRQIFTPNEYLKLKIEKNS